MGMQKSGWRSAGARQAVADDARDGAVRPTGSTEEAGEQSGANRGGVGGGKRWDREECGPAKHGPDTEPGSRVTGAGPHTRAVIGNRQGKLTALLHHINIDVLRA